MHALVRRTLGPRSTIPLRGCRFVAGRRYRLRPPQFHSSAVLRRDQDDPADTTEPSSKAEVEAAEVSENGASTSEVAEVEDGAPDRAPRVKEAPSGYGSAIRRSNRHRRPKEIPPVEIPEWFMKNNVRLHEELGKTLDTFAVVHDAPDTSAEATVEATTEATAETANEEPSTSTAAPESPPDDTPDTEPAIVTPRYQLHQSIWNEVLANIRSGLSLPPSAHSDSFAAHKVHLVLQCPKDGGIYFLDAVVEQAALETGADLLRLDAQDIAEIGGNYLGEGLEPTPYSIRSLAYDVQQIVAKQDPNEGEEAAAESEEDMEGEEDEGQQPGRGYNASFGVPTFSKISAVPIRAVVGTLEDLLKSSKVPIFNAAGSGSRPGGSMAISRGSSQSSDQWEDMKMTGMAGAMLEAADMKTLESQDGQDVSASNEQAPSSETSTNDHAASPGDDSQRPLIVQIRDFKEIQSTTNGRLILRALHNHIRRRRKAGQAIMLVGTVSSAELIPSVSRPGFRSLQAEFEDGPGRTIVVTPVRSTSQDGMLSEDERRRIREINLRHLQDMLRQRTPAPMHASPVLSDSDVRLDSSVEYSSGLEEAVWPFDRVHRVVSTVLGLINPGEELTPATISKALQLLDSSDETKFQWAVEEAQTQKALEPSHVGQTAATTDSEARMRRVRKNCNTHEKKLLGGVIDPESIRTTFADVHVPAETITALKTLTTLSLIRPDAFTYGVLATDSIPGLLLYGPPGTGKTLLAKAVAKESGATVLEVSGSEVYDMFVGEGEKNVKAIFTLARKLSPCVVFIDEADAIFSSRSGQANRTSHRELINQFLREWDGMNDLSAFIMVATNRPFDLDDAVLRRLPRRLLVDLPVANDREAILRIHLKDEKLEPSVSLSDLAKRTPFYSGSDLKNLAVAAALTCVREETPEGGKRPDEAGTGKTKYPERRVLAQRHFDKAMEEISASISEDMSSLAAIRKFDEKYGDRKGRRKKRAGWGFGSAADAEQRLETGRVRN